MWLSALQEVTAEPVVPSWLITLLITCTLCVVRLAARALDAHQLTGALARICGRYIAAVLLPSVAAFAVLVVDWPTGAASMASVARRAELSQLRRPPFATGPGRCKSGQGTTAVSTPNPCGGVDGGFKAGVGAAIGQGWLADSTRDEHDGQGPEKTLRQPAVLSVFWSREACGPCGVIAPRESSDEGHRSFCPWQTRRAHFASASATASAKPHAQNSCPRYSCAWCSWRSRGTVAWPWPWRLR